MRKWDGSFTVTLTVVDANGARTTAPGHPVTISAGADDHCYP